MDSKINKTLKELVALNIGKFWNDTRTSHGCEWSRITE